MSEAHPVQRAVGHRGGRVEVGVQVEVDEPGSIPAATTPATVPMPTVQSPPSTSGSSPARTAASTRAATSRTPRTTAAAFMARGSSWSTRQRKRVVSPCRARRGRSRATRRPARPRAARPGRPPGRARTRPRSSARRSARPGASPTARARRHATSPYRGGVRMLARARLPAKAARIAASSARARGPDTAAGASSAFTITPAWREPSALVSIVLPKPGGRPRARRACRTACRRRRGRARTRTRRDRERASSSRPAPPAAAAGRRAGRGRSGRDPPRSTHVAGRPDASDGL